MAGYRPLDLQHIAIHHYYVSDCNLLIRPEDNILISVLG